MLVICIKNVSRDTINSGILNLIALNIKDLEPITISN